MAFVHLLKSISTQKKSEFYFLRLAALWPIFACSCSKHFQRCWLNLVFVLSLWTVSATYHNWHLGKSPRMPRKRSWSSNHFGTYISPLQSAFLAPNSMYPRETQFTKQTFFYLMTLGRGWWRKTYKHALTVVDVASLLKKPNHWPQKTLLKLQVPFKKFTNAALWNGHSCFRLILAENSWTLSQKKWQNTRVNKVYESIASMFAGFRSTFAA